MRLPFVAIGIAVTGLSMAAANVEVGSTRAEVLRAFGQPRFASRAGDKETLVFSGDVRVQLEDGQVIEFSGQNRRGIQVKSRSQKDAASPSVMFAAASRPADLSSAPAPRRSIPIASQPLNLPEPVFTSVPEATIVTDPNFRPRGTAGGESDGRTLGIDGKPLADHKIYANDCQYYMERLAIGLREMLPSDDYSRLSEVQRCLTPRDPDARARAAEEFAQRYIHRPEQDLLYPLAQLRHWMQSAIYAYQEAEGQLNYTERLRVKDRVHLDQAPNAEGAKWRNQMKSSIARMHQVRTEIQKRYGPYYEEGRRQREAEAAKARALERFAQVNADHVQLLAYSKFERTPMLAALAAAHEGQTNLNAKPIFVAQGEPVQILDTTVKEAMGPGGAPLRLELSRVRVKSEKMTQHDGKRLPLMTLEGWVLSRDLQPKP